MPDQLQLVIGAISLPVLAELILWLLHKGGLPEVWDKPVSLLIALAFTAVVVVMNFYPQYNAQVVAAVTFLYTLLTAVQKLFPETVTAVRSLSDPKVLNVKKSK